MAGEKRFRTSLLGGFNKADVNAYIEKILRDFEEKLREKDNEILVLKEQYKQINVKHSQLSEKAEDISKERAKIADALIKAQEKAANIVEEARIQAGEEKKNLESIIEQEKEKLVDIREQVKYVKGSVLSVLKSFDSELNTLLEQEALKSAFEREYREEVAACESETP